MESDASGRLKRLGNPLSRITTMRDWIAHRVRRQMDAPKVSFCPFCGAVLSSEFAFGQACPQCHETVALTQETAPIAPVDIQAKALSKAVLKHSKKGYCVVRQKRDFAEMRKPRRFSIGWAAAWFAAGIPLPGFAPLYVIGYAVWHALRGEDGMFIYVDPSGVVREERVKQHSA